MSQPKAASIAISKQRHGLSFLLCWILILQIGLAPAISSAGAWSPASPKMHDKLHEDLRDIAMDPVIAALEADDSPTPSIQLANTDPVLDQDPFFLKSQGWEPQAETAPLGPDDGPLSRKESDGVTIQLPGSKMGWKLAKPLHPILQTDEYIYLAADEGSGVFREKGGGEGIFILPYSQLISASVSRTPVPVFFLPMPLSGWVATKGRDVAATEIPDRDMLIFTDTQGNPLPILMADMRAVVRTEALNFLFATAQGTKAALEKLKDRPAGELKQLEKTLVAGIHEASASSYQALVSAVITANGSRFIQLPPGSTAGFGVLYTGFDLNHPDQGSLIFASARAADPFWKQVLGTFSIRSAFALDPNCQSDHFSKIASIVTVFGLLFIGSVVARHTVLRKKIDARMESARANGEPCAEWRNYLQIFGTFAAVTAKMPVTAVPVILYVMDRVGVSEQAMLRKLFNATYDYYRQTAGRILVNIKTLFLGGVVGAVTDTTLTLLESTVVAPYVADRLGEVFPGLEPAVRNAFHSQNNATNTFESLAPIQSALDNSTSGPYKITNTFQLNRTIEARNIFLHQMIHKGKNPDDPKHPEYKDEFDYRVKAYVERAMRHQGFPGEEDYLLDTHFLIEKGQELFGIQAPDGQKPDEYLGTKRPGLMPRALTDALRLARELLRENPHSKKAQQALALLENQGDGLNLIRNFLQDPFRYANLEGLSAVASTFKDIQKTLTSLTFKGAANTEIEDLPDAWKRDYPRGALLAAQLFRQAFFALLEPELSAPSVLERIGSTFKDSFSSINHAFERSQIQHALVEAQIRTAALQSGDPEAFKKFFHEELLKESGIHPDYSNRELLEKVEGQVQEKLRKKLQDPNIHQQLKGLSPEEKDQWWTVLENDLFAAIYVRETAEISQLTPAQPGITQRIRQMKIAKGHPALTAMLRAADGMFSDAHYSRGIWPKLARTIPLISDWSYGITFMSQKILVSATLSYPWDTFLFHSTLPFHYWLITYLLSGFLITGQVNMSGKITKNLGIKINSTVKGMLAYTFLKSWLTFSPLVIYPLSQAYIGTGIDAVALPFQEAFRIASTGALPGMLETLADMRTAKSGVEHLSQSTASLTQRVSKHVKSRAFALALSLENCSQMLEKH